MVNQMDSGKKKQANKRRVEIREPIVESPSKLRFVAFTEEEVLNCELIFLFPTTIDHRKQTFLPTVKGQKALESTNANSTADDVFRIILYLPTKPTAYP